jgi:hypothetical protein
MKTLIAALALIIICATSAMAQQSSNRNTARSFYDGNGHFAGSSTTYGNSTSFSDRNGHFDGNAIRNSDGTTSFYDRHGHFTGSARSR